MYSSADPAEIEKFARMAQEWWEPNGKFRPLHRLNPTRLAYVRDHAVVHFARDAGSLTPLAGLSLLDIGCGGGLMAEPLCRLGAEVTGIDATEKNVHVARLHAERAGLPVTYRHARAEELLAEAPRYDIVLALEIVEHVSDPAQFLADCAKLLKPGGMLVVSTLNRTLASYALAIVGAEYVLRWLPRGTHEWRKFLKPAETWRMLEAAGVHPRDLTGMVYKPISDEWQLTPNDVSVNYLLWASNRL